MKFTFFALFVCAPLAFIAQVDSTFTQQVGEVVADKLTLTDLEKYYGIIYMAAISIVTYLASFFPQIRNILPDVKLRALVIAAIVGVIFYFSDLQDGFWLLLEFLGSGVLYDKVMQPIGMNTKK